MARGLLSFAAVALIPRSPSRALAGVALAAAFAGQAPPAFSDSTELAPWRARDAAGAPPWLDFGLAHRVRVEHMQNNYRAASGADATALVMRTLLFARASFEPVFVGLELLDSRAYATDETPLGTSSVNAFEVLQAHLGLQGSGLLAAGDTIAARLGRITMDVGSRRFVARNRYRNTINGFTGVDAQWTSPERHMARAFLVVPVRRLPGDAEALRDNEIELDEEDTDTVFWGGFYASPALAGDVQVELFAFGLHEEDGDRATRDRQLVTPGFRVHRKAAAGELDFQVETAVQVGTSRATAAADDTTDLDHRAFFARAELGFTLEAPWAPRLVGQYDYASGDGDPDDGTAGRFDTLFGARRFDFGPTGIYGPFARANLSTPGVRVQVKPHAKVSAFAAYRLYWLASDRDAWTTAGLRDPTGDSGSFLGQQGEVRVRWDVLPKNLRLETGAAHLVRGGFADSAPDGRDTPSTLLYAQVTGTL